MAGRNEYLDQGVSDISDAESGYNSEEETAKAKKSKRTQDHSTQRGTKRRKLSHSSSSSSVSDGLQPDGDEWRDVVTKKRTVVAKEKQVADDDDDDDNEDEDEDEDRDEEIDYKIKPASNAPASPPEQDLRKMHSKSKNKEDKNKSSKKEKIEMPPGVVYLSSLPPYLKPSALRNILAQRGFSPITRLFLTPASKHKRGGRKSSRQLYTEGWIEFASKRTAKRCASALNAQLVGGKKGGFYHDDLWNMKYLRGMAWEELMAGIREEKREEEGRKDEERRRIASETKAFVEGVERGKKIEGMKRKRQKQKQGQENGDEGVDDVQMLWRQHEVVGDGIGKTKRNKVDPEVRHVLSQIL